MIVDIDSIVINGYGAGSGNLEQVREQTGEKVLQLLQDEGITGSRALDIAGGITQAVADRLQEEDG